MSTLATNAITDASGGNTTTINGFTPTVSNMAGRNKIINGDMRISQRGTSFANVVSQYTLDRWKVYRSGTAEYTVTQSSDAPDGFANSLRLDCSTVDDTVDISDYSILQYNIEGLDLQQLNYGRASALTKTLSFWVKSNVTGIVTVSSELNIGPPFLSQDFTIYAADTWEYKTLTYVGNTTTAIDNDNSCGIELQIWLNAGSNFKGGAYNSSTWHSTGADRVNPSNINISGSTSNYFQITGVQLEAGSVATPFEYRQYGQELALCQRYYEQYDGVIYPIDVNLPDTSHTIHMAFSERKRSAPTITLGSGTNLDVLYARTDHDQTHGVGITTSHSSNSQGKIESPAWIASAEL